MDIGECDVYAIDKVTMRVVGKFKTMAGCARALGVNTHTVRHCIADGTMPAGRLFYRYRWAYDPFERFDGKSNRPVLLTDIKTGEKLTFCDMGELVRTYGLRRDSVSRNNMKGGSRLMNKYKVEWLR